MEKKSFKKTLRELAGHLVIESDEERRNLNLLYKSLAQSALPVDKQQLTASDFSIGKADLFFDETIPKDRLSILDKLAENQASHDKQVQYRVFIREVPIREPLLHGSVPSWAAGARISHSIGPFLNKDGRRLWYDFYPVAQFISLYIQGISEPVLLCKIRPIRPGTTHIGLKKQYSLEKGSIWINARFLAPNAPKSTYTGLSIDGGNLRLSAPPVDQNGKLTVFSNTTISLSLKLHKKETVVDDTENPYGVDAQDLELALPTNLSLHFSSHGRTIDAVSDAKWRLYGQKMDFSWNSQVQTGYHPLIQRIIIPFSTSTSEMRIRSCKSKFNTVSGSAKIRTSGWALPVAAIDLSQPGEASGTGAVFVQTKEGFTDTFQGLEGDGINLASPGFLVSPGQILLADLTNGNPHASQSLNLWQDGVNEFGTTVELTFPFPAFFFYATNAAGAELYMTFANSTFHVDRPVKVNGEPPAVHSLHSLYVAAAFAAGRFIYLFDDNLLQDNAKLSEEDVPEPMALALTNALFKVSQANGCLLFGSLSNDGSNIENGLLFLTFGLYAYLPTLPDPYAANLGILKGQIRGRANVAGTAQGLVSVSSINAWLVCRVGWKPPAADGDDLVDVSFHFAPLDKQFSGISFQENEDEQSDDGSPKDAIPIQNTRLVKESSDNPESVRFTRLNNEVSSVLALHTMYATAATETDNEPAETASMQPRSLAIEHQEALPDYEGLWDATTGRYRRDLFALLDVSTNADLYGVSFNLLNERYGMVKTHVAAKANSTDFPFQVQGMEVVSQGHNVKAFTVPQISWEPIINLTQKYIQGDPPAGVNYYPNDGGPMQILNNSEETVALSPLPLTEYLLTNFAEDTENFAAYSFLTLPFGLKALAVLQNQYSYFDNDNAVTQTRPGTEVGRNAEEFTDKIKGALQFRLNGGEAFINGESDMFVGSTVQLNNVLNAAGSSQGDSTLGATVTEIFNNEFFETLIQQRGVPLTRIDLSGYGASCFSNWLNPAAAFAQTSQAKFDIFVGRCAHEIIQVKSIIYPWAIKVVRTITIFRVDSGYVYRFDSGWRAESNGEFDFRYFVNETADEKIEKESPFAIHPGIIKGLYNVQNIIETEEIAAFEGQMQTKQYVDADGLFHELTQSIPLNFKLQPVYFDADIDIENTVSGFTSKKINGLDKNLVPSKKIVGYVQSAPKGIPITTTTLKNLILLQMGSIGGPIDCEINLAGSDQKMRLHRFDFSNSFAVDGSSPTFAVAGRGNMLLPGDGSWSMVMHERDSGKVSPVPSNLGVPVIRVGQLIKDNSSQKLDTPIKDVLLRIANPSELLRSPADDTVNYGFLQSTDTQKALFLTPAFEVGKKILFSQTPPLFADSFRIVNSKAVFPNIGNGETDFGDAIKLISDLNLENEFKKGQGVSKDVWKLMDITGSAENIKELGYKLLKNETPDFSFELPDQEFELIDVGDGNFRIYIEYKQGDTVKGDLDFNINSLTSGETWKSHMAKIGLVVDLAGIDRLMTIRGNWDSKKGSEASYPKPDIKFAKELQPVIDILEILQQLQTGDYAGAVASGLKLAMSNKAGTWEYKFEASKEIPVLRFPPTDALYNDPNTPFKLEAGLSLGAYFNAALKVTNSANELLPSAGGMLGFYGRLSVMCVSISAVTVYAIGQVDLTIAADTQVGPSLRMKFGFGAQIVIGLPVAGNVSVLFVVGIEIYAAAGIVEVTAFLLFEGHAEILGGIVAITIKIEAKGTVSRKQIGAGSRADMTCQVTFGLDISIFLVINISFETSWSEQRQIA